MEDTKKEVKKATKKKSTNTSTKNKTNSTKKTSTAKKSTGTKKSTTTKKTASAKKTSTAKKSTTKKQVKPEIKTIEENKVDIKNYDPKEVEETAIDTKEERNDIAVALKEEKKEELTEIKEEVKLIAKEEKINKINKNEKVVDYGVVIVIIGLFILVLTTYLTSAIDLSYQEVNILVIISIAIEALGVAIMLVGSIKK